MKLHQFVKTILLLTACLSARAEIILQGGQSILMPTYFLDSSTVTGVNIISIIPSASTSPVVASNLQRAHAWSSFDNKNNTTGAPLIYSKSGSAKDTSSSAKANIARAQAFRLDYFK